jgi:acetyl esterase/lipase
MWRGMAAMAMIVAGFAQAQGPQPLWPAGAPGAQGSAAIDRPSVTAYLPASNPTKTGVLIFPGGGYQMLSMENEGTDIAHWLNARGVAAFLVQYRLGPKYRHPSEMQDGQRAVRLVRARAAEFGIASGHIGVWGSSAGGHLAATVGTQFDAGKPDAADEIDRQSSRPDFMILAYPVISMEPPVAHLGSRLNLLGSDPDPALAKATSAQNNVTKATPPAFLFATSDDSVVPVMNSVLFYSAMVKAGAEAEMHLYEHGPHGVGLASGFPRLKQWPDLLAKWMAGYGWMGQDSAAKVTVP